MRYSQQGVTLVVNFSQCVTLEYSKDSRHILINKHLLLLKDFIIELLSRKKIIFTRIYKIAYGKPGKNIK